MSSETTTGTLYVVDAHSLIYQVFHAIRGMTSPTGVPTNALFGFVRDMLFLRSLEPTYIICAFDLAEPTFRSAIYPDYKAHRPPPPDDLQLQIPLIRQAMDALRIPVLSVVGFEADDIMATLAKSGEARGLKVLICTADKDCRQLITDRVKLYSLRKREEFGKAELLADWGVTPEQVVDLQAMVGDSVDNVPGVPGVGLVTGAKLLQQFGTLDNLMANVDQVQGKKQQALRDSMELVKLSRSLVRLDADMQLAFDWENWKLRPVDVDRATALCREWGFQSLVGQIRAVSRATIQAKQPQLFSEERVPVQEELFPFGANATEDDAEEGTGEGSETLVAKKNWSATYHLVDSPEAFDDLVGLLKKQKRFAIDLETTSLEPHDALLVGVAVSWTEGEAYYVAVRGPLGEKVVPLDRVIAGLKPILEDERIAKINQNIKYDFMVLRAQGINVKGLRGDPMVAHYLLHAGERSHNLEDMAKECLNHQVIPITDLIGKKTKKTPQLRMDQVPTDRVAQYAGEDADVALRLTHLLEPQLDRVPGLRKLYDDLEVPLIEVLAEMEYNGIRIDVALLKQLGQEMAGQLTTIEKQIYAVAGHEFNIGSLPQLRKVLFEELKLPVQGKTATTGAASTDQETLEKLAVLNVPGAELPRKVLEYRQIDKLKSTYIDALPELVNKKTGRVHTNFNQTVAATGRLSSTNPNIQNIPVRRENGQQIRQAFLPAEGCVLLTADYSQIELRLLAHFCGDDRLVRAFEQGHDIHASVAAQVFNVPEADVTSAQRRMAKTVNFGVIYGISPGGLAQRLGITRDEGTTFIKAYFAKYPKVEAYQSKLLKDARQKGFVTTIMGRRRKFDPTAIRISASYSGAYLNRNTAEREAINMEVQGSAADLIKLAMLNVYRAMERQGLGARLLLQIHDELVFESPPGELQQLAELVRREMTDPVKVALNLRVPLTVDLSAGPNWLQVEKL